MEPASPRSERLATIRQQIESHLVPLDLESIKQIAETDKDYFPKDFIAQCLKHFSCPANYTSQLYHAFRGGIFLDAFTWFVEEFGPTSPGYLGLGKSKEEVIDLRDDRVAPREFFKDIWSSNSGAVLQKLRLVVAKSLIESFGELGCIQCAMKDYLKIGRYVDARPPERWGKFKMMVECLIIIKKPFDSVYESAGFEQGYSYEDERDEDHEEEDWTIGDDGNVLIGHAIVWLFETHRCRRFQVAFRNMGFIAPCLLFVKDHEPNVFLARSKQGRTLLDIVIRYNGNCLNYDHKSEIVRSIVQEDPDACLRRGRDGRLPIHLALRMKDQDLFDLIFNAATSVANQKCQKTRLYPYQLAAAQYTDSNSPDLDWSDEAFDSHEEDYRLEFGLGQLPGPTLLLSRIYELLRHSPNLVGDGILPDCRVLSHPESIAIAREELEFARFRDRNFQIERERAAKISERKQKHRGRLRKQHERV
jgi:hypothetical protein